jgi:Heterokaryon incompatibility protein Het-C
VRSSKLRGQLPELIEQVTNEINIFVFSLLAPFVLPIINQVKEELATGSSEIIQSSKEKQHIVFHDDYSSDPTHSMLSKGMVVISAYKASKI